jgi:hypothetical protein
MCQESEPTSDLSPTKQKTWDNPLPLIKHEMNVTQLKKLGWIQPVPSSPRTKHTSFHTSTTNKEDTLASHRLYMTEPFNLI